MDASSVNEDVLKKNKELLGDDFGEYFTFIYNDIYYLIYKWQEYNELFNTKKRVDVLNESTSSIFSLFQNVLITNIVLSICRLTDPIKQNRTSTLHLSIYKLPEYITDMEFKTEIYRLCSEIRKKVKEIRLTRDNYIAHSDLNKIINRNVSIIEYKNLDHVIDLLYQLMKSFYAIYFNSDLQKETITSLKGAHTLVNIIDCGLKYRKEKYDRILAGNYTEDDIKPRETI
jgi:AbiU2